MCVREAKSNFSAMSRPTTQPNFFFQKKKEVKERKGKERETKKKKEEMEWTYNDGMYTFRRNVISARQ